MLHGVDSPIRRFVNLIYPGSELSLSCPLGMLERVRSDEADDKYHF
jgi:hypothetical protein